ncbi:diaminobutyrate--2-oxoglutarate transaminase [Actinophytocola algeriensis]|uniref:Diaminobutyrate--2-oxoglutarate transaminase n=1 Tax=Actinophytocola algeriensis TaxID=1768010 RepID=A0A7W7VIL1_9PSEU|nr:diaminobutyrate--2-oxoglutarate transaminase [Actinophytocola algeriensis]MBB4911641.1 diaminobutyrate-2-oxoglutarate transaminase [Actinophytocola algeriensis]MBE1473371.1 diaminobutyrate-2-oxoglutarate transaminase [Actinophytocola algeriensis]
MTELVAVAAPTTDPLGAFEERESVVRSYCRAFPAVFAAARGSTIFAEDGVEYVDFFCGAGALNYGHNHEHIRRRVIDHLERDGLVHALDCYTPAKRDFLERFGQEVLEPRGLSHRVQFCGSTGTDAVEAALKLARKHTGRAKVIAFSGAYHGVSRGSLAATADLGLRKAAGVPLDEVAFVPFPVGPQGGFPSVALIERMLTDDLSGVELPAAVILEVVQMEGGVYRFPDADLRALRELCDRHGIVLIVDEIQAGCGRTGDFFSFERAGIVPDLVTVSKSISGLGLPMSILLIREGMDSWDSGDHPGTFRGNQLAFVAACAALDLWQRPEFLATARDGARLLRDFWRDNPLPGVEVRCEGHAAGIDLTAVGGRAAANAVVSRCFERGLVVESTGRGKAVVKLLPALNMDLAVLRAGCELIRDAVRSVLPAEPPPDSRVRLR